MDDCACELYTNENIHLWTDLAEAGDEMTELLLWDWFEGSLILSEVWEPGVWGILLN